MATSWWRDASSDDLDDLSDDDSDDEQPLSNGVDLVTGVLLHSDDADEEDALDYADVLRQMSLAGGDVERPQRLFPADLQRGGALNRTVNRIDLNNASRFQIEGSWRQLSDTFNMYGTVYEIKPSLYDSAQDFMSNCRLFLVEVFDYMSRQFNPSDQISCHCTASGFDDSRGGGVGTPFMRLDQFRPAMLLQQIEAVVQSNEAVAMDDGSFSLQLFRVILPGAGERINRVFFMGVMHGVDTILQRKRSLLAIPETMHPFCMVASLWGAKKLALERVREHRRLFQNPLNIKVELRRILREAKLTLNRERIDLADLKKVAKTSSFRDHPVVVWSREDNFSTVAKYNVKAPMPPLYIYLKENEIFIVRNLRSLLDRKSGFFCIECETSSASKFNHVCTLAYCRQCKTVCDNPNAVVQNPQRCPDCKRFFNSDECFANHKKKHASPMYPKKKVCLSVRQCPTCRRDIACKNGAATGKNAYNSREHVCFKVYCSNCGGHFDPGKHLCHIRHIDLRNEKTKKKYEKLQAKRYFYDIETNEKISVTTRSSSSLSASS